MQTTRSLHWQTTRSGGPFQPIRETIMEKPVHSTSQLFSQLGLPSDAASICRFIDTHRPLPDTMKSEHAGRLADTLERDDKWLAQTPQMFRIGALLNALDVAGDLSHSFITDESSAMERLGHAPKLVRGSAQNFKVTYPEDFALAEAVLLNRQNGR